MVISAFLMVRTGVTSKVFSMMSPMVSAIWTRSPVLNSGDDVGNRGDRPE